MRIDILTIFPEMFVSPLAGGIFRRAIEPGLVTINVHNIRDHAHDRHRSVDDYPYGGGAGMVFKPEPVFETVEAVQSAIGEDAAKTPVILLTPQGRLFTQEIAAELAAHPNLVLVCGHYEGVDERIAEHLTTDLISIGDYVLSGGELPALVVADAVVRLLPGVLGSPMSSLEESHSAGLLEYPQYTRPPVFRGWAVPEVLLSGNHAEIARWRREQSIIRTACRRPDLLTKADLSAAERESADRLRQSR